MPLDPSTKTHASLSSAGTEPGDGTNSICHGFLGGVQANSKHVIDAPQVTLVLWDSLFANNSAAVTSAKQLVTDLLTGPYMNGLAQYGVARGALVNTVVVDTKNYPAPATWDVNDGNDLTQLKTWFTANVLAAPPKDNTDGVFFIVLPNSTQLTNGKNKDGTPNTSVVGWHHSAKYNSTSSNNDLFWGLVLTKPNVLTKGSEQAFINGFAYGVAHELCETFTNRDGNGYTNSNGCEIGDICEADTSNNLITFPYKSWSVEPYWSSWDSACIHGDAPVSLQRFFTAINFNSNTQPLSALGTPVINLDYIASRMR
ncbi:MAG TPA: hypothetical protein VL991_12230 [Terracidiphilus sp.]|nr:hypothetical protein [Terracidiphilus sp.]